MVYPSDNFVTKNQSWLVNIWLVLLPSHHFLINMQLILVELGIRIINLVQKQPLQLRRANVIMVQVVNHHCCKFVKVHVLNIFEDKSVNHLGKLHYFGQEYWIILHIWAPLKMVCCLNYQKQVKIIKVKNLPLKLQHGVHNLGQKLLVEQLLMPGISPKENTLGFLVHAFETPHQSWVILQVL